MIAELIEWTSSVSLHGVNHIAIVCQRSYNWRRFWAFLLLVFLIIFAYLQVQLLITIFIVKPTTVDVFYERETELNFPNLVICDLNLELDVGLEVGPGNTGELVAFMLQLSGSKMFEVFREDMRRNLSEIEKYPLLEQLYARYISKADAQFAAAKMQFMATLYETLSLYNASDVYTRANVLNGLAKAVVNSISPTKSEMVKFCSWKKRNCLDSNNWKNIITRTGVCQEFTPSPRTVLDTHHRLNLIFDFESKNGLGIFDVGGGLQIQIQLYDPTQTVLTTSDKSSSFYIGPGHSYNIQILTRKFRDFSGFTGCIEEGKMNQLKYQDLGYTQKLCVSECVTDTELQTCGCVTTTQWYYSANAMFGCSLVGIIMCPLNSAAILRHCEQKCKPQCSSTEYDIIMSAASFPNPGFAAIHKVLDPVLNLTNEYMKENYAELTLSYGSLVVRHTNIYAQYEIFSTASAMGSLLGLMLGGSMLTIFEIAELSAWVALDLLSAFKTHLKTRVTCLFKST